jgi:uncharacterized membrane protein
MASNKLHPVRIEALSDGLIAIVLTLLVIELKVPHLAEGATSGALLEALAEKRAHLFAFFLAFLNVATLWIAQRTQFHFIKETDRTMLWLTMSFFFFVSLIPFSSALIGEYPHLSAAVVIYGMNLVLAVLSLYLPWWYSVKRGHLAPGTSSEVIRSISKRLLVGPLLYLVGCGIASMASHAGLVVFTLIPIAFMLQSTVDVHLGKQG